MWTPADNGGGGQKLANSCGRLLWMAPNIRFVTVKVTDIPYNNFVQCNCKENGIDRIGKSKTKW